jgi:hypothetical protein
MTFPTVPSHYRSKQRVPVNIKGLTSVEIGPGYVYRGKPEYDLQRPGWQSFRFWRLLNFLAEMFQCDIPCRVCGGTSFESEWHRPRWRVTLDGGRDWICFACLHQAARSAGIVR